MKARTRFWWTASLALAAVVVLSTCSTSSNGRLTLEEETMAKGRDELARGNYVKAKAYFSQVAERINPGNSEAHFFVFVSHFRSSLKNVDDQLSTVLNLVNVISTAGGGTVNLGDAARGAAARLQSSGDTDPVNSLIRGPVRGMLVDDPIAMRRPLDSVTRDKSFQITYSSFPISLAGQTIVDIGGRYDLGEVYLFRSLTHLIEAVGHLLLTLDFNADIGAVLPLVLAPDFSTDLNGIIRLIVQILNRSPEFLTLAPDGQAEMKAFTDSVFAALGDIINSVFVTAGKEVLPDDFIAIESRQVLPFEPACLAAPEDTDDETTRRLCLLIRVRTGDGTPVEIGFPVGRELVTIAAGLVDALFGGCIERKEAIRKQPPDLNVHCRISWADHIAPLIGNLLPPLLSSGVIFVLLDPLLDGTDSASVVASADAVFKDCGAILNPDMLTCTMLAFIPDAIELDAPALRSLIDHTPEGYVRKLIPCWVAGPDAKSGGGAHGCHLSPGDEDTDLLDARGKPVETFLWESECGATPEAVPEELNCDAAKADYPHFNRPILRDAGIEEISEDGILSVFPYLPIPSPSMRGMLWMSLESFPNVIGERHGYAEASLRDFNVLIAHLGSLVGSVLGGNFETVATPVIGCLQAQLGKVGVEQLNKCLPSAVGILSSFGS